MEITRTLEINKNIEEVWKVLGDDFAHPYKWASSVHHSEGHGEPIESLTCNERSCDTVMGQIKEKLTHFSEGGYSLAIEITEGLPKPIQKGGSSWELRKISNEKTLLILKMEFKFKAWAAILKGMMKKKLSQMATDLTEDLAHYVEKGEPHPRKVENSSKYKASENPTLKVLYLLFFIIGTAVPLYFIVGFIQENGGVDLSVFVNQLFASKASSTFASDLLICSFVFWVFLIFDKKTKNAPHFMVFILINLTIGLSSALPLYLFFKEKNKKIQMQE
jgi:hypothetical protein